MGDSTRILSDSAYDKLKWTTLIALPALGALYFALAQLWDLPYAEAIVGTLAIVATFIGSLIGISTRVYNGDELSKDGYLKLVGTDENGMPHLAATFNKTPDELMGKKEIRLKVDPTQA